MKSLTTVVCGLILAGTTASVAIGQLPSYERLAKTASWGANVHAFQLGIVPPITPYKAGGVMDLVTLIRNNGPALSIVPPGDYMFDTILVDIRTKTVLPSNGGNLNVSGAPSMGVANGRLMKITLDLRARYGNPGAGTYRLTASTNIYEGSSFPARAVPVYAHIISPPITITVSP